MFVAERHRRMALLTVCQDQYIHLMLNMLRLTGPFGGEG